MGPALGPKGDAPWTFTDQPGSAQEAFVFCLCGCLLL